MRPGTIVFGWVFAAHQVGAALASVGAGYIRDLTSDYTMAWLGAAGLCAVAALMSLGIRKVPPGAPPESAGRQDRSTFGTRLGPRSLIPDVDMVGRCRTRCQVCHDGGAARRGPVAREPRR